MTPYIFCTAALFFAAVVIALGCWLLVPWLWEWRQQRRRERDQYLATMRRLDREMR